MIPRMGSDGMGAIGVLFERYYDAQIQVRIGRGSGFIVLLEVAIQRRWARRARRRFLSY
jgi:hypothetical protein